MKTVWSSSIAKIETLEGRRLLSGGWFDGHSVTFVHQTNLVTSGNAGSAPAAATDPNLINPWGMAASATSPFWISDNGTGLSSLYTGAGTQVGTPFTIPPGTGSTTSNPTGQVFSGGLGFVPDPTQPKATAVFIFVGEDGGITAWNPAFGHSAKLVVDNGNADPSLNAVYKGVTIADVGTTPYLYATNFRSGQVEVYNQSFQPVSMPGGFVDHHIPSGFAPFNIQAVGNDLYVTYAEQDAAKHDDVPGAGNGFVDEFNSQGMLIQRFQHGGFLNSPWAVAQVPNDGAWEHLGNDILIGNFGSGLINVFSPSGKFDGFLHDDVTGKRVTIDGLWGLRFGNGGTAGPADTLFFTAGTNGESAGLFGSLTYTRTTSGHHDHDGHDDGDSDADQTVADAMNM